MTSQGRIPSIILKEARALGVAWLLVALAIIASALASGPLLATGGVYAYCIGSVLIGALSIGHEYTYRTLPLLLAQPAERRRTLLVKLAVLTAVLLSLGGLAWLAIPDARSAASAQPDWRVSLIGATMLVSFSVAPLLTMLARNPVAGAVFATALAASTWVLAELLTVALYGRIAALAPEMLRFKLAMVQPMILAFGAAGAFLTWRTFDRLQVIEGPRRAIDLTRWRPFSRVADAVGTGSARRHPLWLLARKELRLHSMSLVVAALYAAAWAAIALTGEVVSEAAASMATVVYSALLSLVIGSLAYAEEKQLGTSEWQQLLPMAASRQWAAKAGVALSLALLLGVALPALLALLQPAPTHMPVTPYLCALVILLSTGSLYVSSLSNTGLHAFLLCFPTMFMVYLVFLALSGPTDSLAIRWVAPLNVGSPHWLATSLTGFVIASFTALILKLGFDNQRSNERRVQVIVRQAVWIASALALGVLLEAMMSVLPIYGYTPADRTISVSSDPVAGSPGRQQP